MKHFINILLILILSGMTFGVGYLTQIDPCIASTKNSPGWGILYVPIIGLWILLGAKINHENNI